MMSIYIRPQLANSAYEEIMTEIKEAVMNLLAAAPYVIVSGDFNDQIEEVSEMLNGLGLEQADFPSREHNSYYCIDAVFSNLGQPVYATTIKTDISDHCAYIADFMIPLNKPTST
jgi:endonuclease/exonuclease/phosphatase (EEP) superfamily protein YafD